MDWNRKSKRDEIRGQTELILKDRKNANLIPQILAYLDNDQESWLIPIAQTAVSKIVDHLIRQGDLSYQVPSKTFSGSTEYKEEPESEKDLSALDKYRSWIQDIFNDITEKVLLLLQYTGKKKENTIREVSLVMIMKWLVTFHEKNTPSSGVSHWKEEDSKRLRILLSRLLNRADKKLVSRFQEYMEYIDVREQVISSLLRIIRSQDESGKQSPLFFDNFLTFLEILNFNDTKNGPSLICHNPSGDSVYKYDYDQTKKNFSSLWEEFLKKTKLTPELYKRVLIIISDKVMPYLNRPLLLTDFLINSYNVGGSISLLALKGVFNLIQKYNLEYPDFYTKLYALLTPDVLFAKYKARFFHLADIFLTSTHLPEYLVAAFIKRLSRIALTAPANALPLVFQFIGNLLIRHHGLLKMIQGETCANEDPFLPQEEDPSKCKAVDSSLWEIETLMSHSLPQVSQAAKFITKKLPEMEWDLSSSLELSMMDMMDKESKKKIFVNVPLTFERPVGFKFMKTEKVSNYFLFE